MAAEGGVLRQVNVGGIVGICDAARAVPCRIGPVSYTHLKHMNRAALLRGLVAADLAAPHVEYRRLI